MFFFDLITLIYKFEVCFSSRNVSYAAICKNRTITKFTLFGIVGLSLISNSSIIREIAQKIPILVELKLIISTKFIDNHFRMAIPRLGDSPLESV